ncbi:MAG: polysaccharide lyase 6 family protein [Opitutaceae bacterium]|nr:polysaccharide lyase 6 family protein [Opitutaceae bacterium]
MPFVSVTPPLALRLAIAALVALGSVTRAAAATTVVRSLAELQLKLNDAAPGDTLTLKDGVYTTDAPMIVNRRGAEGQPITIAAETVGGVEIAGTHGFTLISPAGHIVVSGFVFTHNSGKTTIAAGTSHVRFSRNTFRCPGEGPYLTVNGHDAQIDFNEFAEKKSAGAMIAVGGTGAQIAQRLWIHHNHFHDLVTSTGESAEMIRYGLSALSLSLSAGVVEHNLFARCRGENELISNRSSGNTYRFNTFIDSPSAQVTLRHGNACRVYGNVLRNTEGLRLYGDRHVVHSNLFEGNYIGVNLGNGGGEVADGAPLASHDRPDDCVIAFNTFLDNRTHYQMSRRTPTALGAQRTVFAYNVLQGGGVAAKIDGPYTEAVWTGNVVWSVAGPGSLPPEGLVAVDPKLAPGEGGIVRPQEDSPLVDVVEAGFTMVSVDIDGQSRLGKKDAGADERSEEPRVARLLTPEEVGPLAK